MDLSGKCIGIWGYGIGGTALVDFLLNQSIITIIFDQHPLSGMEQKLLQAQGVGIASTLDDFLAQVDYVVPSAGVDVRPYHSCKHKLIAELDFFSRFFHKPIIAVTGTLGKTTVTTCLAQLLERSGRRVVVGGNMGIGLCSLIEKQNEVDCAVIEVSSFQLEHCKQFAPAVAVWTNFFPNHLDRHDSIEDYFAAKLNITKYQRDSDLAIVPADLLSRLKLSALYNHRWYPIPQNIPPEWHSWIDKQDGIQSNWVVIGAVLSALNISLDLLKQPVICSLEHRMEYVATIADRIFYNDSKATVQEATLAAVERLCPAPIILLLGGLGKGISRASLICNLKDKVKKTICFGAEAEELAQFCKQYHLLHAVGAQFDAAVKMAYAYSSMGDVILLSPGGSSFDLFQNYQERGMRFKQIVSELKGTL